MIVKKKTVKNSNGAAAENAIRLAHSVIGRKSKATGGTSVPEVPKVPGVPGSEKDESKVVVSTGTGSVEIDPVTGKPKSPAEGGSPATAFMAPVMADGAGGGNGGGGDGTAGGLGDTAGGGGYGSEAGNADSASGSPAGDGGGTMGGGDFARGGFTKKGGKKKIMPHSGPINSLVAGRTDHLPMHVRSGSYVIPADIISAMGEGNTSAGFRSANIMFGGNPYGGKKMPYGASGGPYGANMPGKAEGGGLSENNLVPIVAAGGEYVLSPEQVMAVGKGDLDAGHQILDHFVKKMRQKTIKTLSKLPGPKKN